MTDLEKRIIEFAIWYNSYLFEIWDGRNHLQPGPWADERMQFPVQVFRSIAARNGNKIMQGIHEYTFRFPDKPFYHQPTVAYFVDLDDHSEGLDEEFACKA